MMAVFNELYADQYDLLYEAKDYATECDLVETAFAQVRSEGLKSVLDIGCGTGKHALELAKRGYEVVGVDLSKAMLAHARRSALAVADAQRPKFLHGDAKDFETGQVFESAIMMFAVIGYLVKNDDVLTALRNIRRQLKLGAPFICDFWYGPSVLAQKPEDRVRVLDLPEGQVVRATTTTLDTLAHTADVSFRLWEIGNEKKARRSQEVHRLRYFFPEEMRLMMQVAGFEMNSITAFPSLTEVPSDTTWNALVVATAC
jgi:SAM-dependent methyltransferase